MLKIQEDIKYQGITLPFYVLVSQLFQIETFQVIFESAEIVCSFLLFRGSIPYGGSNERSTVLSNIYFGERLYLFMAAVSQC